MSEDNSVSIPEPPPPSNLTTNSTTSTNREVYDGGANERTPLINQQPSPINNFQAAGQNNPVSLGDTPKWTTCPYCSQNVTSKVEYESPRCSCWCCLCNSIRCFIPICVCILKIIYVIYLLFYIKNLLFLLY
jgi:hypothetical protein